MAPTLAPAEELPVELRLLFVDELPMPKRPQVGPGSHDREVFVTDLPTTIETEEEVCQWFGLSCDQLESAHLLRDGAYCSPRGQAYILFRNHEVAAAFIEAEGSAVAKWSESERAVQRVSSVYGADIHAAFTEADGQVLPSIKAQCGVRELWALSGVQQSNGEDVPPLTAQQLHFAVDCSASELEDVQLALASALERFHEWIALRMKRAEAAARWKPSAAQPPTSRYARALARMKRGEPPRGTVKPGPNSTTSLTWNPATGQYQEEEIPAEVQELMGVRGPSLQAVKEEPGPWTWTEEKVPLLAVKTEPGVHTPRVVPPPRNRSSSKCAVAAAPALPQPHRDAVVGRPALLAVKQEPAVERGEELVRDARAAATVGLDSQALAKYREGLEYLLDATPEARSGESAELTIRRKRISGYLTEMEALAKRTELFTSLREMADAGSAAAGSSAVAGSLCDIGMQQQRQQEATGNGEVFIQSARALAAQGQIVAALGKYHEGLQRLLEATPETCPGEPDNFAARRRRMSAYLAEMEALTVPGVGGAASSATAATGSGAHARWPGRGPGRNPAEEDSELQRRVGECEAMMRDAHVLEDMGMPGEAHKRYRAGLLNFIEMVQDLGSQTPDAGALRAKVDFCLAGALTLKKQIQQAGMSVQVLPDGRLGVKSGLERPPLSGLARPFAAPRLGEIGTRQTCGHSPSAPGRLAMPPVPGMAAGWPGQDASWPVFGHDRGRSRSPMRPAGQFACISAPPVVPW
mmetsp:Transcript_103294/g.333173  ORF Transcript_103294/g.333173 Transcript_103294/m.333173 type:complete len:752 (+) Transcript_103294:95-2350(+)